MSATTTGIEKKPRVTEKTLRNMTLRQLTEVYNELNEGQAPISAASFRSRDDARRRILALRRRQRRTVVPASGTLRAAAEELLKLEEGGEGLRYSEILENIQERFPECRTSRSSLRWYAAQMRARGEQVPSRPLDN